MSPTRKDDIVRSVEEEEDVTLRQLRSAGTLTISPELFEKLYLTPKSPNNNDFRKRFANPTPLGFMGFCIADSTFAMILMGWGGSTSFASVAGIFFFTGPLLLTLTTIFEWIMGNFFPMMVCGLFAIFWLSFGMLQLPTLALAASYSTTGDASAGALSVGYNAGIALYLISLGFAMFSFFIFTLKTNLVFAMIFALVTAAVFILAAAYFHVAAGAYEMATHLQHVGGALSFVVAILGWYATFVMMAIEMRLTLKLPVGDLSRFWPRTDVELGDMEKKA